MKTEEKMDAFGATVLALLAGVNVLHLLWTVWLTAEQIQTGWGYGTDIEMLALLPWLTELVCIPALIVGLVYLILSFFFRHRKGLTAVNAVLFAAALVQYALTNLFLWF